MAYLLDANVFISAKNLHYGFDFCPAFWDWITQQNKAGKVFSIEKVGNEIQAGDDELSTWASNLDDGFFLTLEQGDIPAMGTVSTWATTQNYTPAAQNTFLQIADYYIVSQALASNHIVVTHEIPRNQTRTIKIPNACIGVNVKYITPYEMLRQEKARFVLGSAE